jgi:hypothetical protein
VENGAGGNLQGGMRYEFYYMNRQTRIVSYEAQISGAEMLRIACRLGIESGIEVCAPVHDAVLIAAPLYLGGKERNDELLWEKVIELI